MLKFGNKEFRNLQEQVYKNQQDIRDIQSGSYVLDEFGIKVVGEVDTIEELPTVAEYKAAHEDWAYGDAFAIGTESPYQLMILTRADNAIDEDHWFNIGQFPMPGPQGEQGETGPQGPKGDTGDTGAAAGFGTIVATATTLNPGVPATATVVTSGPDTSKSMTFTFGIPRGQDGEPGQSDVNVIKVNASQDSTFRQNFGFSLGQAEARLIAAHPTQYLLDVDMHVTNAQGSTVDVHYPLMFLPGTYSVNGSGPSEDTYYFQSNAGYEWLLNAQTSADAGVWECFLTLTRQSGTDDITGAVGSIQLNELFATSSEVENVAVVAQSAANDAANASNAAADAVSAAANASSVAQSAASAAASASSLAQSAYDAANAASVVSGTASGGSWTTITIDGTTNSIPQGGSGDAVWGSITGTLSNQTDLQNALNGISDDAANAANKAQSAYNAANNAANDASNASTAAANASSAAQSAMNAATDAANLAQSAYDAANAIVVPTKTSDLTNDSGYITGVSWGDVSGKPTFATVATTGDYDDLLDKPDLSVYELATDAANIAAAAQAAHNAANDASSLAQSAYDAANAVPVVSGVNDGTNWTSITIGSTTKAIPQGGSGSVAWGGITGTLSNQTDLANALADKQNELISGVNIKTINNQSVLGSGNIDIQGGNVEIDDKTIVENAQGKLETAIGGWVETLPEINAITNEMPWGTYGSYTEYLAGTAYGTITSEELEAQNTAFLAAKQALADRYSGTRFLETGMLKIMLYDSNRDAWDTYDASGAFTTHSYPRIQQITIEGLSYYDSGDFRIQTSYNQEFLNSGYQFSGYTKAKVAISLPAISLYHTIDDRFLSNNVQSAYPTAINALNNASAVASSAVKVMELTAVKGSGSAYEITLTSDQSEELSTTKERLAIKLYTKESAGAATSEFKGMFLASMDDSANSKLYYRKVSNVLDAYPAAGQWTIYADELWLSYSPLSLTGSYSESSVSSTAVSGANDGTNWTSITIGSVTKAIPSGGGGGSVNVDGTTIIQDPITNKISTAVGGYMETVTPEPNHITLTGASFSNLWNTYWVNKTQDAADALSFMDTYGTSPQQCQLAIGITDSQGANEVMNYVDVTLTYNSYSQEWSQDSAIKVNTPSGEQTFSSMAIKSNEIVFNGASAYCATGCLFSSFVIYIGQYKIVHAIDSKFIGDYVSSTKAEDVYGFKTFKDGLGGKLKLNSNSYTKIEVSTTILTEKDDGSGTEMATGILLSPDQANELAYAFTATGLRLGYTKDNTYSLGQSAVRLKNIYLGGVLSDGTNSVSVADLAALITYAKGQG